MGCSLFSNSHFQMGVIVMGFAEHFEPCCQGFFFTLKHDKYKLSISKSTVTLLTLHAFFLSCFYTSVFGPFHGWLVFHCSEQLEDTDCMKVRKL